MIFRQLFDRESFTYTYLLADQSTKEGILIDPVRENLKRDLDLIKDLSIKLLYTIETHVHADHVTSAYSIREQTGAQMVFGKSTGVDCADRLLDDHELLEFGEHTLRSFSVPGHTDGCMAYLVDGRLFTGDALLIRGCGRTDFQNGSSNELFDSVREKIFSLPDETLIYPAHDYQGRTSSSVGEEKKFNPRLNLNISKEKFGEIMSQLKLDLPKKIHEAVPANIKCGQ